MSIPATGGLRERKGLRWTGIISGVAIVVLTLAIGFFSGGLTRAAGLVASPVKTVYKTHTVYAPPPGPAGEDYWASFEHKASYIGQIGSATMTAGRTYWMPSQADLVQDGNGEWFITDPATPVLGKMSDAGPYPLELTLVDYSNWDYETAGDSELVITLPSRVDFSQTSTESGKLTWTKGLYPYGADLTLPQYQPQEVVPVSQVVPASGLTLADYFVTDPDMISKLPVGKTAQVSIEAIKWVQGTNRGWMDVTNDYYTHIPVSQPGNFDSVTNTGHGYVVCNENDLTLAVSKYYVPMRFTEVPITFSSSPNCAMNSPN